MAAVLPSCGFSDDAPAGYHERWVEANADVFERLEAAQDGGERDRALRWHLLLH